MIPKISAKKNCIFILLNCNVRYVIWAEHSLIKINQRDNQRDRCSAASVPEILYVWLPTISLLTGSAKYFTLQWFLITWLRLVQIGNVVVQWQAEMSEPAECSEESGDTPHTGQHRRESWWCGGGAYVTSHWSRQETPECSHGQSG